MAAWPLAVGTVGATAAAGIAGLLDVLGRGPHRYAVGDWAPPWGIEVVLDPLSAFLVCAIAVVATLTLLAGGPSARATYDREESTYYSLVLLLVTGLLGMVVSGDLFNVFVFLEVASISSYALVASGGGPALAAAFRYVVLGTVGASFYLLGVGCLYALTGTLNMADLAARLPAATNSPLFVGGIVFIVVGLGVKMGLFPLHGWLPDAYTRAPAPVTAVMAPVGTKAAAYVLARVLLYVLRPEGLPVGTTLAWVGAVAIVAGGILAAMQVDARRLLAYSSVSQMGYIALGLGLGVQDALIGCIPPHPGACPHEGGALRGARRDGARRPGADARSPPARLAHADHGCLRGGGRALRDRGPTRRRILLEVVPAPGRARRRAADPGGRDSGRESPGRRVHVSVHRGGVVRQAASAGGTAGGPDAAAGRTWWLSPWPPWPSGSAMPRSSRTSWGLRPRGSPGDAGVRAAGTRAPAVGVGRGAHRALAPAARPCARPGASWRRSRRARR